MSLSLVAGPEANRARFAQLSYLRMLSVEFRRLHKQCQKKVVESTKSAKKCFGRGAHEAARVHAETAVRARTQRDHAFRMQSRLDGVRMRVQAGAAMSDTALIMLRVVRGLMQDPVSRNPAISTNICDAFTLAMQDAEMAAASMDVATGGVMTEATPQADVDELLQTIGDEVALKQGESVPEVAAGVGGVGGVGGSEAQESVDATLDRKLRRARREAYVRETRDFSPFAHENKVAETQPEEDKKDAVDIDEDLTRRLARLRAVSIDEVKTTTTT